MGVSVCQWDRRWDEQINGEGHREVLRVSEVPKKGLQYAAGEGQCQVDYARS